MTHLLKLTAALVAAEMITMTIQGDLKDLDEQENCIPRAMGVKIVDGEIVYPFGFIILYHALIVGQAMVPVIIATEHGSELITVVDMISGGSIIAGVNVLEKKFDPAEIKSSIVMYTVLISSALILSALSFMGTTSVILLVSGSIVWGLGWLKILFGDTTWFA